MSVAQSVVSPAPLAAQAPDRAIEVDAAHQEVPPPEQRAVTPDATPTAATMTDESIAPKERPPLPQPESSVQPTAPASLEDVTKAVEQAAAKNAGELIEQANKAGAAIPGGLAVTVTIQPATPVVAPHTAHPAIEQPAIAAEAKPEGLALAAEVPAQTIATPAVNEATIAPQPQRANGVSH